MKEQIILLPKIAFFDMDHTVIDIDAEVSWKYFLADEGIVADNSRGIADHYWRMYIEGNVDVGEFLRFQHQEFVGRTVEDMNSLAMRHFEKLLKNTIYPDARKLIDHYNSNNVHTALLTGSNQILSQPVANEIQVATLLATEAEIERGIFTGSIVGEHLSKEGKLNKASEFCEQSGVSLNDTTFYADSINDLPLLKKVGDPIVVNPAENLLAEAQSRNWSIMHWTL